MALPEIPLLDVGADWPTGTVEVQLDRAHALLDESDARFPQFALGIADALSRRWLARWHAYSRKSHSSAGRLSR